MANRSARTLTAAALCWTGGALLSLRAVGRCSFQSAGSERESTVRTIIAVDVARGAGELSPQVRIEVEGDGFLYNMVRIIAGTLVEVGMGRRDADSLGTALSAGDRSATGRTAPPQGLILLKVDF
jgi:tRNA pseudouridine38-40 synthase